MDSPDKAKEIISPFASQKPRHLEAVPDPDLGAAREVSPILMIAPAGFLTGGRVTDFRVNAQSDTGANTGAKAPAESIPKAQDQTGKTAVLSATDNAHSSAPDTSESGTSPDLLAMHPSMSSGSVAHPADAAREAPPEMFPLLGLQSPGWDMPLAVVPQGAAESTTSSSPAAEKPQNLQS